jgi:hypothetical protein
MYSHSDDQQLRSSRGNKYQQIVFSLFEKLQARGLITEIQVLHRLSYQEFPEDSYYFPFAIVFEDGAKWLIQTSTGFPRERIHGYQWNAFHSKQIDSSIEKALVVYPDSARLSDVKSCTSYNRKIFNHKMFTSLDGVISFADLYLLIESKWLEYANVGKRKALQGTAFEKWLVDILTHPANIENWNNGINKDLGFNYPYFEKILEKFGFDSSIHKFKNVDATDNIPNLPPSPGKTRGGKPKTDILVKIELDREPGKIYSFTISSKRTSSEWVAINQYSADTYINVLNIKEPELKDALYELERTGAPTQISDHSQQIIRDLLPNYYLDLAKWAYAGIGGEGDPHVHWAKYFTVYKNETKELEFYHIDEYIQKIITEAKGQLGSPFQFTYTGDRGTNIQLRGKIL